MTYIRAVDSSGLGYSEKAKKAEKETRRRERKVMPGMERSSWAEHDTRNTPEARCAQLLPKITKVNEGIPRTRSSQKEDRLPETAVVQVWVLVMNGGDEGVSRAAVSKMDHRTGGMIRGGGAGGSS